MAEALREFEKYDFFERTDYEEPTVSNIAPEEFVIPAMLDTAAISGAVGGAVGAIVSKLMG